MMTMMLRTTKITESHPWIMVLRTTASMAATVFAVPNSVFPSARALENAALLAKYPTAGTGEKILYALAVMVTTAAKASGSATIQMYLKEPRLAAMARQTDRAMAASSWLAMPKSGKSVLMPPSGSVTPISSTAPHAATMMAVQSQAPGRQECSLNLGTKLPIESCSMKRATRVPASTAVRMNSASNMMAKWYQNAIIAVPPMNCCMMWARPTASVGAPPVRRTMLSSPTLAAVCDRISGVRFTPDSPRLFTQVAAVSTVPPVKAAGEFMAKYSPRSMEMAATSAMMATKDSISMPP